MQQPVGQATTTAAGVKGRERLSAAVYGSDLIVDMLRELEIPYAAMNPGASWRGLHDSLVNFGPGKPPEMLLCNHEEIAVALAHGYTRATGQPMAAIVHDVVGLQHASMAIFNAWCDRVPLLVLGGTGPMDANTRRPWIDWIHTALVQGNQVRDYVKWDDQPSSVEAIPESLLRAYRIAMTEPQGPVYVCFDSTHQEERLASPIALPDVRRFAPPRSPAPDPELLSQAAALLVEATWPVIIADGVGRHPAAISALRELAELLGAPILDKGSRFNISNGDPLDLTLAANPVLQQADVVLALDVKDMEQPPGAVVGRTRESSSIDETSEKTIIHITLGDLLLRSWVPDTGRLMPVDLPITADTALALPALVTLCRTRLERNSGSASRIEQRRTQLQRLREAAQQRSQESIQQAWSQQPISSPRLYGELWQLIKGQPWTLAHGNAGQARRAWEFTESAQLVGGGGGGGLGFGPGGAIGKALAHKGSGRLCIGVLGDGDLLYTPSALWTAAHHRIPLLLIVWNNHSYYQDEGHQEYMATSRDRPKENAGVGIHITDPITDFVSLAKAFDVEGFGPVTDPDKLGATLEQAIRVVTDQGRPALVDVISQPR